MLGRILNRLAKLLMAHEVASLHRSLRQAWRLNKQAATSVPSGLLQALVAGEDRRFFRHSGLDTIAVVRAAWQFAAYRRIQGASTIEQQLVRTLTGRYERSLRRKAREMLLATCVGDDLDKPQIALTYLLVAHYGWGMMGVVQACRRLGYDPSTLSRNQAASLVARLKYPQPQGSNPVWEQRVARRARHIASMLSQADEAAWDTPITGQANAGAIPS
jgi:penicillin-binding protein 1A